ncbi:hypothetical protein NMY22_g18698 [Coprinellus aureogranulatus]|nr:hypothetical protein NMY22_g18698 [Coprinellus aureogranulatus]
MTLEDHKNLSFRKSAVHRWSTMDSRPRLLDPTSSASAKPAPLLVEARDTTQRPTYPNLRSVVASRGEVVWQ